MSWGRTLVIAIVLIYGLAVLEQLAPQAVTPLIFLLLFAAILGTPNFNVELTKLFGSLNSV